MADAATGTATGAPARAAVRLQRITEDEMQTLARGATPAAWAGRIAEDALLPEVVAQRALRHRREGVDAAWCDCFWVLRRRGAEDWIVGTCGFKGPPVGGAVEIGYGVAPAWQRQGLASQAVALLCHRAFEHGARAVRACIAPDNAASIGVAQRLRFTAGPTITDPFGDLVTVWTLEHP